MEREFIDHLRRVLPADPRLLLGLGDDAALLAVATGRCAVTCDMLGDGVDFHLRECGPRKAGRKALAVNLSDLAAMAVRPLAAVVAVTLPRENALPIAKGLYEGIMPLAEEFEIVIAGGDTGVWDGPLSIAITALGEPTERGVLTRGGARPGDKIVVSGTFGGSILGRHLDFEPRVREALLLHDRYELHAGMDVSDGLSLDLSRLCAESGVGAVIDVEAVPLADAARELAAREGGAPLDHALGNGEDFELLLAVPADAANAMLAEQPIDPPLTCIGEFTAELGFWRRDGDGLQKELQPRGYLHGT